MFKLDLEKAEEPEINCQHPLNHRKSKRISEKNIYFCFIDYGKAFDCVDYSKLWRILKEMGIPDYLTCLLRNLYAGQEAAVRTRHGTLDWIQIGKECVKAVYCHLAYLTYMQNTSCKMLGWMKHKLELNLNARRNINNLRLQVTPPSWQKEKKN